MSEQSVEGVEGSDYVVVCLGCERYVIVTAPFDRATECIGSECPDCGANDHIVGRRRTLERMGVGFRTEVTNEEIVTDGGRVESADEVARVDELEEKVEELEDLLQSRVDTLDAKIEHNVKPRLEDLQDTSDDAQEERAELGAKLADHDHQIAQLQTRVEMLAGVENSSNSNPEKRVADLREAMIRRADARGEKGRYHRIKLWWEEVQGIFAELGHGEISKPDCYKAMEEAAAATGFEMGTKDNEAGREVKAVAVDTEALREEIGSSDPTTPNGASPGQIGGENAASATQD